ncbi:unnamed protein product [Amoebophrya sp. A25]|nr:unnamed protein product [Amoebophrya sp. A25]|eukprot:GSA25T00014378001.1
MLPRSPTTRLKQFLFRSGSSNKSLGDGVRGGASDSLNALNGDDVSGPPGGGAGRLDVSRERIEDNSGEGDSGEVPADEEQETPSGVNNESTTAGTYDNEEETNKNEQDTRTSPRGRKDRKDTATDWYNHGAHQEDENNGPEVLVECKLQQIERAGRLSNIENGARTKSAQEGDPVTTISTCSSSSSQVQQQEDGTHEESSSSAASRVNQVRDSSSSYADKPRHALSAMLPRPGNGRRSGHDDLVPPRKSRSPMRASGKKKKSKMKEQLRAPVPAAVDLSELGQWRLQSLADEDSSSEDENAHAAANESLDNSGGEAAVVRAAETRTEGNNSGQEQSGLALAGLDHIIVGSEHQEYLQPGSSVNTRSGTRAHREHLTGRGEEGSSSRHPPAPLVPLDMIETSLGVEAARRLKEDVEQQQQRMSAAASSSTPGVASALSSTAKELMLLPARVNSTVAATAASGNSSLNMITSSLVSSCSTTLSQPTLLLIEFWQLPMYHLSEFLDMRDSVSLSLTCKEFYESRRIAHVRLSPQLLNRRQFDRWLPEDARDGVLSLGLSNIVLDVRSFRYLKHFKINLDMSKKLRRSIVPTVTTDSIVPHLNLPVLEELCMDSLTKLPDLTAARNLRHVFLAFRYDTTESPEPLSFKCGSTKLRSIQLASCNVAHATALDFPPLSAGDICAVISQLERPDKLLHLRLRRIRITDNVRELCGLVASECSRIRMFTFTTQPLALSFVDMLRIRLELGLVAFSARSNGAATADVWPNFWPSMRYFWPKGVESITPFTVFSTDFAFDELNINAEEEWDRLSQRQLLRYEEITAEVRRIYNETYPLKRYKLVERAKDIGGRVLRAVTGVRAGVLSGASAIQNSAAFQNIVSTAAERTLLGYGQNNSSSTTSANELGVGEVPAHSETTTEVDRTTAGENGMSGVAAPGTTGAVDPSWLVSGPASGCGTTGTSSRSVSTNFSTGAGNFSLASGGAAGVVVSPSSPEGATGQVFNYNPRLESTTTVATTSAAGDPTPATSGSAALGLSDGAAFASRPGGDADQNITYTYSSGLPTSMTSACPSLPLTASRRRPVPIVGGRPLDYATVLLNSPETHELLVHDANTALLEAIDMVPSDAALAARALEPGLVGGIASEAARRASVAANSRTGGVFVAGADAVEHREAGAHRRSPSRRGIGIARALFGGSWRAGSDSAPPTRSRGSNIVGRGAAWSAEAGALMLSGATSAVLGTTMRRVESRGGSPSARAVFVDSPRAEAARHGAAARALLEARGRAAEARNSRLFRPLRFALSLSPARKRALQGPATDSTRRQAREEDAPHEQQREQVVEETCGIAGRQPGADVGSPIFSIASGEAIGRNADRVGGSGQAGQQAERTAEADCGTLSVVDLAQNQDTTEQDAATGNANGSTLPALPLLLTPGEEDKARTLSPDHSAEVMLITNWCEKKLGLEVNRPRDIRKEIYEDLPEKAHEEQDPNTDSDLDFLYDVEQEYFRKKGGGGCAQLFRSFLGPSAGTGKDLLQRRDQVSRTGFPASGGAGEGIAANSRTADENLESALAMLSPNTAVCALLDARDQETKISGSSSLEIQLDSSTSTTRTESNPKSAGELFPSSDLTKCTSVERHQAPSLAGLSLENGMSPPYVSPLEREDGSDGQFDELCDEARTATVVSERGGSKYSKVVSPSHHLRGGQARGFPGLAGPSALTSTAAQQVLSRSPSGASSLYGISSSGSSSSGDGLHLSDGRPSSSSFSSSGRSHLPQGRGEDLHALNPPHSGLDARTSRAFFGGSSAGVPAPSASSSSSAPLAVLLQHDTTTTTPTSLQHDAGATSSTSATVTPSGSRPVSRDQQQRRDQQVQNSLLRPLDSTSPTARGAAADDDFLSVVSVRDLADRDEQELNEVTPAQSKGTSYYPDDGA